MQVHVVRSSIISISPAMPDSNIRVDRLLRGRILDGHIARVVKDLAVEITSSCAGRHGLASHKLCMTSKLVCGLGPPAPASLSLRA